MSSRRTFKKCYSSFFTKVSCRCGCQEYRKRQAKRIAIKKDGLKFKNLHCCANVYKHLFNRGDVIYLQKPSGIHILFDGRRKHMIFEPNFEEFSKQIVFWIIFSATVISSRSEKIIGIAERNAMRLNIMYYVLNKSHEFIKRVINDVIKNR